MQDFGPELNRDLVLQAMLRRGLRPDTRGGLSLSLTKVDKPESKEYSDLSPYGTPRWCQGCKCWALYDIKPSTLKKMVLDSFNEAGVDPNYTLCDGRWKNSTGVMIRFDVQYFLKQQNPNFSSLLPVHKIKC